jgi:hypothetical protein
MIYKVANIINTNVVLRSSMPFLQIFKLFIIIFECNGFVQCQPMFIHINWVYSVYPIFFIMKQFLFQIEMALNQYIPQLHFFELECPKMRLLLFVEVTFFANIIVKINCNCITLNLSNQSLFAFFMFKFKGLLGFNFVAYFSM